MPIGSESRKDRKRLRAATVTVGQKALAILRATGSPSKKDWPRLPVTSRFSHLPY